MKVLSVKQPWAHAIIHGGKDIENRNWSTKLRGRILIHASMKIDPNAPKEMWDLVPADKPVFGGIIGSVEIVDCVVHSESKWFSGPYGFVLKDPQPLEYRRMKGKLRFFDEEK